MPSPLRLLLCISYGDKKEEIDRISSDLTAMGDYVKS